MAPFGQFSVMGISAGLPYTVAEDEKMKFLQPLLRMAFNSTNVAFMLFS